VTFLRRAEFRDKKERMKTSSIIALVALGAATCIGLAVFFQWFYLSFAGNKHGLLFPILAVAVAAALFVLGVFLGYPFGKAALQSPKQGATLARFREALEFERKERIRLERELCESREIAVSLEDRLRQQIEVTREQADGKRGNPTAQEQERLKAEIADAKAREENVKKDLLKRKQRIADLMAELSVAQTEAEQARREVRQLKSSLTAEYPASRSLKGTSVKEILEGLVALAGVQVALVADDFGLVVEAAGAGLSKEMLAALSSLVAELGPRAKDVLPIGEVATISLADDKGLVIDTRFFELSGARCALSIARDASYPYPGLLDRAAAAIAEKFAD